MSHPERPVRTWIIDMVMFVLLLGASTLLLARFQIRLTYDSHDFLASSNSLSTYLHGKNADGSPYLHRPPLLPAYLHFFENKTTAATVLNILSLATSLFLVGRIIRKVKLQGYFMYASFFAIALGLPWIQNHFFLWTEPLFTTLILLLVYSMMINSRFALILILCIAMFMLRKSGLFVAGGVAIFYLSEKRYREFCTTAIVMSILFAVWEYLTVRFAGVSTSKNIISYLGPLSRVDYLDGITSWCLPRVLSIGVRVIVILIMIFLWIAVERQDLISFVRERKLKLLAIVSVTYLFALILFFGVPDYYEAERYLSVVFPLVFILAFTALQGIHRGRSKEMQYAIVIMTTAWLVYPAMRTINFLMTW